MKKKITFVVNSRANYARIKSVISESLKSPGLDVRVVVGASAVLYNYGNVSEIMEDDGIPVHARLYNVVEGNKPISMAKTTGLAINDLAQEFLNSKPDLVITVADRFETIATAVAASYMNIAVAHTQGGELTGSIDENVRHSITKLSHFHFPATLGAVQVLRQLGEEPKRIFHVGCPSIDLVKQSKPLEINQTMEKYSGVGEALNFSDPFILVSQHPDTLKYMNSRDQIYQTLQAITKSGMQAIWLWPNMDAGSDSISKLLREYRETKSSIPIHFYRNFSAEDYINVLKNASCIVGNSSSGIRESSFIGLPCVNIGPRQNGRERTENVIDVNYNKDDILGALKLQINHGKYTPSFIYGDGNSGMRMTSILENIDSSDIEKKFIRLFK